MVDRLRGSHRLAPDVDVTLPDLASSAFARSSTAPGVRALTAIVSLGIQGYFYRQTTDDLLNGAPTSAANGKLNAATNAFLKSPKGQDVLARLGRTSRAAALSIRSSS